MNKPYNFKSIEPKWRHYWREINLYKTGDDPAKPTKYILDYFPYPSGTGLSVGHCRNYIPTCVSTRFHRMKGFNVLHPMGWDAFGLPAENYAVKHKIHPRESTRIFADTYRRQMQLIECAYDWSREINSTDPGFYKWTQFFFLLLYERGLAYQAVGRQWWCPECQTILANEQVEAGRCWRCDSEVTQRDLEQWYFKITDYADRLLADLESVDWPESIKQMQRNWIGRSEGVEISFQIPERLASNTISVFTTRPDTLYGVTFLVLSPEHPLVETITTSQQNTAVSDYVEQAKRKSEIERSAMGKDKSGVFTGAYAIHPLTKAQLPIWIADFVMMGVGTGAVMGVPAHDERDFSFAQQNQLPIVQVISANGEASQTAVCFTGHGILINSGKYNGLDSKAAMRQITAELQARGVGSPRVTTKLRDWLISRQRYWGAPIPIIHCPACGPVPVPLEHLPVELPETDSFAPAGDGRSPLARIEPWVNVPCPQCGGEGKRETDTMDGFACSSWYFLRFTSPHDQTRPFDPVEVARWLPVDSYVGGAEHAVMHLLYARFWTKVMHDAGMIHFSEPFTQLRNQGMLLSPMDGQKMSKSKGNVITPDEVIEEVGTDALRAYVLFLGPFDQDVVWEPAGIRGITRFLDRVWRLVTHTMTAKTGAAQPLPVDRPDEQFERRRHQAVQRLTAEMETFRMNTAVAGLMEYFNYLNDAWEKGVYPPQWSTAIRTFLQMLAPICPFITEALWQEVVGGDGSIHHQPWPSFDPAMTLDQELLIMVQVNGKLRDRMTVPAGTAEAEMKAAAVALPKVQKFIANQPIKKLIVVQGKLVNIVV